MLSKKGRITQKMGNKKHKNTPAENERQRKRTHRNKVKKYSALIKKFPNAPERKIWEEKLKHSQSRI